MPRDRQVKNPLTIYNPAFYGIGRSPARVFRKLGFEIGVNQNQHSVDSLALTSRSSLSRDIHRTW
jgi:hypothetical protein